jgi:hypothetical protein
MRSNAKPAKLLVLMRGTSIPPTFTKFYVHDHLYSPAPLAV